MVYFMIPIQEGTPVDVLYTTQLSIPPHQIVLLLLLSMFALLFGKVRLALLTNYLFTMYWGYFFSIAT